jgi:hypothetical protein
LHCYQFTISDVDEHMQRDCIAVALERANDRGESCDCPLHALRIILHLTMSDGTARIASMHHNNATDRLKSIEDIQDNA